MMNSILRCRSFSTFRSHIRRFAISRDFRLAKDKSTIQLKHLVQKSHMSSITSENSDAINRPLASWLFGVAALVAGMVTVGGVTRLTRSGLSMTDWKLQGSMPPLSTEDWEKEFERYKQFPEWQQRKSMTIEEFKYIYFWEYGHRMMGRTVGLAFVLPGVYFGLRGRIPRSLYPRLGLLFSLGGGQGLIGWWMVKSGLEGEAASNGVGSRKEIRVSPYRLATHLCMAFTTYGLLLWTGLQLWAPASLAKTTAQSLSSEVISFAKKSRRFALHNVALAAVTVLSGAYVAGNDAGRAFNTFPKMGDDWIPSEALEFSLRPIWRNFVENTALVQFDHRVLALSTLSAIGLMYASARKALQGAYWKSIPKSTRFVYNAVAGIAVAQVGLGISTLLLYVPIPLAALHQAGSLVLLSAMTILVHSLGFSRHAPKACVSAVKAATANLSQKVSTVHPTNNFRQFSTFVKNKN